MISAVDGGSSSLSSSSKSLCQECSKEFFRYQCPRCSFRSCSLACCVAHKTRTECNGKRDRTKFCFVSRMDDSTLSSDYHFLEDVLGAVERAKRSVKGGGSNNNSTFQNNNGNKRMKHNHGGQGESKETNKTPHSMLQQIEHFEISDDKTESSHVVVDGSVLGTNTTPQEAAPPPGNNNTSNNNAAPDNTITRKAINPAGSLPPNAVQQLGPKWRNFKQQANLRGTNLLLMPSGMQRRKANSSHIKHNILHWKVEVHVHHSSAAAAAAATTSCDTTNEESSSPAPVVSHSMKISEEAVLLKELRAKLDVWLSSSSSSSGKEDDSTNTNDKEEKMHWLMQKLPSPASRPCYIEIADDQATLQAILRGMTVIEYPTMEAVPASRLGEFPRAIEELPRL